MVFQTHRDIIRAWPDTSTLALDLGVRYDTVKHWGQRNSIPPAKWRDLVRASIIRNIDGVSLDLLARLRTGATLRAAE